MKHILALRIVIRGVLQRKKKKEEHNSNNQNPPGEKKRAINEREERNKGFPCFLNQQTFLANAAYSLSALWT